MTRVRSSPLRESLADMSKLRADIVILAEDDLSRTLLRRYCERLVDDRRKIRLVPIPRGKGSGEQAVRDRIRAEVISARRRTSAGIRETVLIIHLDADSGTVQMRHDQFRRALDSGDGLALEARRVDERIALVVPKRHTETWIVALTGGEVDEATDYKHALTGAQFFKECMRASELLFDLTRPKASPPTAALPSLARSVEELRRIEFQ